MYQFRVSEAVSAYPYSQEQQQQQLQNSSDGSHGTHVLEQLSNSSIFAQQYEQSLMGDTVLTEEERALRESALLSREELGGVTEGDVFDLEQLLNEDAQTQPLTEQQLQDLHLQDQLQLKQEQEQVAFSPASDVFSPGTPSLMGLTLNSPVSTPGSSVPTDAFGQPLVVEPEPVNTHAKYGSHQLVALAPGGYLYSLRTNTGGAAQIPGENPHQSLTPHNFPVPAQPAHFAPTAGSIGLWQAQPPTPPSAPVAAAGQQLQQPQRKNSRKRAKPSRTAAAAAVAPAGVAVAQFAAGVDAQRTAELRADLEFAEQHAKLTGRYKPGGNPKVSHKISARQQKLAEYHRKRARRMWELTWGRYYATPEEQQAAQQARREQQVAQQRAQDEVAQPPQQPQDRPVDPLIAQNARAISEHRNQLYEKELQFLKEAAQAQAVEQQRLRASLAEQERANARLRRENEIVWSAVPVDKRFEVQQQVAGAAPPGTSPPGTVGPRSPSGTRHATIAGATSHARHNSIGSPHSVRFGFEAKPSPLAEKIDLAEQKQRLRSGTVTIKDEKSVLDLARAEADPVEVQKRFEQATFIDGQINV